MAEIMQMMQASHAAIMQAMTAPKQVIRDDQGRVVGVAHVN
jgi:hypothetical protein